GIRGEGELQRVNGFGDEKSSIVRAGLAVPLLEGFALRIDAERNSIFHSVSGRVPWILGVRFEHSLTVPMLRTPGTSGYVYQDLNGNQRRGDGDLSVAAGRSLRTGVRPLGARRAAGAAHSDSGTGRERQGFQVHPDYP